MKFFIFFRRYSKKTKIKQERAELVRQPRFLENAISKNGEIEKTINYTQDVIYVSIKGTYSF